MLMLSTDSKEREAHFCSNGLNSKATRQHTRTRRQEASSALVSTKATAHSQAGRSKERARLRAPWRRCSRPRSTSRRGAAKKP
eukprot:6180763-Pleurochrysis_carterae.AAC.3